MADDPIFKPQSPVLTRSMPIVNKKLRSGARFATKVFMERVEELQMKGLDCDPIQILMEISSGKVLNTNGTVELMKPQPEAAVRQKAAAELCSYLFPKRKAVELSGDQDQPLQFVVMRDEDALPGADGAITLDGGLMRDILEVVNEDDEQNQLESSDLESQKK